MVGVCVDLNSDLWFFQAEDGIREGAVTGVQTCALPISLSQVEPIFEEFTPWEKFTEKDGLTLTAPAQRYVDRIQQLTGKEFVLLGTGPAQEEVVVYRNPLDL